ncbi:hypothetical protein WJX74_006148 [Apatococcus lobatus]|uniref:Uncharacterized protein n=1 Tax=Apatococcus lobatus TaxID=904363 RepID=A0AAW1QH02_9CHLO
MNPWQHQLKRVPDLSNEERNALLVILNHPQQVRDPYSFFAKPERAVECLRKLLRTRGAASSSAGELTVQPCIL